MMVLRPAAIAALIDGEEAAILCAKLRAQCTAKLQALRTIVWPFKLLSGVIYPVS